MLFTITRNRFPRWDETEVAVYSRRTGTSTVVITGGADARYVPTGHIIYARQGVLMAAPFDLTRLAVTGAAVGVMPNLMQAAYHGGASSDSGAAQLSIADTGAAAYVPGGTFPAAQRSLVLVDRSGRVEPLKAPAGFYLQVRLSPDGQRLATATTGRNQDVWVGELSRGTFTRLTTVGRNAGPVWTPDGKRIVYRSAQAGPDNLFWQPADGGEPERLTTSPRNQVPAAWSPNGQVRFQVYVQPYPGPGARIPISTDGGMSPVWRHDGQELFYQKADPGGEVQMMSVSISTAPNLRAGVPQMLFRGRYFASAPARGYDVLPDGRHFVMIKHDERPAIPVSQVVLVQNWFEELKRIMTAK